MLEQGGRGIRKGPRKGNARPDAGGMERDGRRIRSERSRRKIILAMVELVESGNPVPTAEATADRAGVSLRTVFRHFEDMNSLHAAMIGIVFERLRIILERPLTYATWPDTLQEVIERRAQFFETLMPYKMAMDVLRHRSRPIERIHRRMDRISRDLLADAVPAELRANRTLFAVLVLLLSMESWQCLRQQQKMSIDEAREVLLLSVSAVAGVTFRSATLPDGDGRSAPPLSRIDHG